MAPPKDFKLAPSSAYKPAPIPTPSKPQETKAAEEKKGAESKGGGAEAKGKAAGGEKKAAEEKQKAEEDKVADSHLQAFSKGIFTVAMTIEDNEKVFQGAKPRDIEEFRSELSSALSGVREAISNVRMLKHHIARVGKGKPHMKINFAKQMREIMKDQNDNLAKLPQPDAAVGPFKDDINKLSSKIKDLKDQLDKFDK